MHVYKLQIIFTYLFQVKKWGMNRVSQTKRKTKEDLVRGCGKDCQARKLNKQDAMDCSRWRKLIKDVCLMNRMGVSG